MTDYQNVLAIVVEFMGVIMGFANIPQALKIYRRRSAKDVSGVTYGILSVGYFVLLLYSISLGDFPLIITHLFGLLGVGLVLSGIIRYEKKDARHRGI